MFLDMLRSSRMRSQKRSKFFTLDSKTASEFFNMEDRIPRGSRTR